MQQRKFIWISAFVKVRHTYKHIGYFVFNMLNKSILLPDNLKGTEEAELIRLGADMLAFNQSCDCLKCSFGRPESPIVRVERSAATIKVVNNINGVK